MSIQEENVSLKLELASKKKSPPPVPSNKPKNMVMRKSSEEPPKRNSQEPAKTSQKDTHPRKSRSSMTEDVFKSITEHLTRVSHHVESLMDDMEGGLVKQPSSGQSLVAALTEVLQVDTQNLLLFLSTLPFYNYNY